MLKALLLFARFNIVGILATGSYFLIGMVLSASTELGPLPIHLAAFLISVVVSYLGHAYFTFNLSGMRYVIRFVSITILLFAASTILTVVMSETFKLSELWTVTAVTVTYPLLSFLLHAFWTFREPPDPR